MRSDTDCSIERTLTSVANLIDHANERARRSVQSAQAGDHENAMNLALEIESLLEEAANMLEVAFAISKQGQDIVDSHGDRKDPVRY
jgi:hypothetical protein